MTRWLLGFAAVIVVMWLLTGRQAASQPALAPSPSVTPVETATPVVTATPSVTAPERDNTNGITTPTHRPNAARAAKRYVAQQIRVQHARTGRHAPIHVRVLQLDGPVATALVRDGQLAYTLGVQLRRTHDGWRAVGVIR